jgi:AcrR family transcriptional regulator
LGRLFRANLHPGDHATTTSRTGDTFDVSEAKTPREELRQLRGHQIGAELALRTKIVEAMLVCSGEIGYRRVTVEAVYKRCGGSRNQFYKYFRNKEDCFSTAFAIESDRLLERLLSRIKDSASSREPMEAALRELSVFMAERPAVARALFIEVHVAGGGALEARRRVYERLSLLLEQTCLDPSISTPPPTTSTFIIGVLEQAVSSALVGGKPEEFADAIPELVKLVSGTYFEPEPPA